MARFFKLQRSSLVKRLFNSRKGVDSNPAGIRVVVSLLQDLIGYYSISMVSCQSLQCFFGYVYIFACLCVNVVLPIVALWYNFSRFVFKSVLRLKAN